VVDALVHTVARHRQRVTLAPRERCRPRPVLGRDSFDGGAEALGRAGDVIEHAIERLLVVLPVHRELVGIGEVQVGRIADGHRPHRVGHPVEDVAHVSAVLDR
jgi:hypothetical protein